MQRRNFLKLITTGATATLLSACEDMPSTAIAPWAGPAPDISDPRLRALGWALLAPNPHNLQSWIADVRTAEEVTLYADRSRLLPETDPQSRQILIGCGAFLELLAIAAKQTSHRLEMDLFPQGTPEANLDERPLARVRFIADNKVQPEPLFAFIGQRHTNRQPYGNEPPSPIALQELAQSCSAKEVSFGFSTDTAKVAAISALALKGYAVEFGQASTWRESVKAFRIGSAEVSADPSGIPLLGTRIWWAQKAGMLDRDALMDPNGMAARQGLDELKPVILHGTPAWVWLCSDNSRSSQIATGQNLMRLWLRATQLGLAMHPNSQVLQEFPAMADLFAQIHQLLDVRHPARIQMLLRLGRAPDVSPSPRRQLAKLLKTA